MAERKRSSARSAPQRRRTAAKKTVTRSRSANKKTAAANESAKPGNAAAKARGARVTSRSSKAKTAKTIRVRAGSQEGMVGRVVRKDDRTGMLFVQVHAYRADPVYADHEWGPYFSGELVAVDSD